MTKRRRINYFIPVAVIVAIGLAIYSSTKPLRMYQQEKVKATGMRSELDTLQKNDAKLREKDQMMNPVQKEEEARRLGYVRPDEVPLPDKSAPNSETKSDEPKMTPTKPSSAPQPIDLRDGDKTDEVNAAPR